MAISKGTAPVSALAKYAYVANSGNNTVSQYAVRTDGSMTPMSTPTVATGQTPVSVATDPSGKYIYVANKGDGTVSQYTIGTNGNLTPMSTPTVATGSGPVSVTVDSVGLFVYVTNFNDGTVSQYTIGTDGSLTPFSSDDTPSAFSTGSGSNSQPASAAVDPAGWYLYVVNSNDNTVSEFYRIFVGSGDVNSNGTVVTGPSPDYMAVDPSGNYAYVTIRGNGTVSQYLIGTGGSIPDPEGGRLTPMSTPTVATESNPQSITIDPSGKYVYVANNGSNTLSQYAIGAGGTLTPMSRAAIAAGTNPYYVTVDFSGKYVYVTNKGDNTVSQYTIGAGGSLTPMSTPAVTGNGLSSPESIVTVGTYR
jgi:DNA-binding beta-propeller fold protein YncE